MLMSVFATDFTFEIVVTELFFLHSRYNLFVDSDSLLLSYHGTGNIGSLVFFRKSSESVLEDAMCK